jgi:hypothetical protein
VRIEAATASAALKLTSPMALARGEEPERIARLHSSSIFYPPTRHVWTIYDACNAPACSVGPIEC